MAPGASNSNNRNLKTEKLKNRKTAKLKKQNTANLQTQNTKKCETEATIQSKCLDKQTYFFLVDNKFVAAIVCQLDPAH